jgi:hypothetical protein
MQTLLKPSQRPILGPTNSKVKRNLDNTSLKKHFGKETSLNIWDKDIYTGEGNE